MKPVSDELAQRIVDGAVKLFTIETIISRLNISRSTFERLREVPDGLDPAADPFEDKSVFPAPDVYIGRSPRWTKETFVEWVIGQCTLTSIRTTQENS
jgi:hypothetical protein